MFDDIQVKSYWLDDKKTNEFNTLNDHIKADVTIVGGGITGITLAYLLSKKNINIVLVDAGEVFASTTGHTTAKITAQHGLIYSDLIKVQGLEKAKMYYKANNEAMNFIKNTINDEKINVDFTSQDAYVFTNSDAEITKIEQEYEAYEKLGINGNLQDKTPLSIELKAALQMRDQAQFHPVKYLNSLTKLCVENGVKFYENTTVVDIDKDENNSPVVKTYEGNKIKSDFVVVASHFPVKNLKKLYFAKLQQSRSYVVASQIKDQYPGGMYINVEQPTRSIRHFNTKDGKDIVFVTGEDHKTGKNIADEGNNFNRLFKFTKSLFDTNQEDILAHWATQDVMTIDKIPYIGEISNNESRILIATGYNKWGMTQSAIAAHELFDHITTGTSKYNELYSPSRNHTTKSIKGLFKNTMEASKEMVIGKLGIEEEIKRNPEEIKTLKKGEAMTLFTRGNRLGAYRDMNNEVHIVDTTCTHMRCETNWNPEEQTWDCPCHGSRFCYSSKVIQGPAIKPLIKYNEHDL